jgi:hypothetical protein
MNKTPPEVSHGGFFRAKQCTWHRTARLTIDVYRKAIESFA